MATTKKPSASLFRLRIELEGITPLIWRRFWMEGDVPLVQLHHSIQAIMGWTDAHLHDFQIGGARYSTPTPYDELDDPSIDDRKVQMQKVLKGITTFGYQYDFGDSWQHTVIIEEVAPQPEHPRGCAFVIEGERACPPEDAGGAHQYQEFLDRLAKNPRHKEVKAFLEWAGEDFNPNLFDRHAANAALLRMGWNQWGRK